MMRWMLEKSRSRTSGSHAMRMSIVGTMIERFTRWRSIRSTARAASNFSMSTERCPSSIAPGPPCHPLVWYSGEAPSTVWRSAAPLTVSNGVEATTAGVGVAMSFGRPVDPELATTRLHVGTASGRGSVASEVVAARSAEETVPAGASSQSATTTRADARFRSRSRSHGGRSWRMGSTEAPAFHAANAASTCSMELGRATTTRSPSATRRATKSWAIWVERRSSSVQVAVDSVPSVRARVSATSSPNCSARRRTCRP